MYLVLEGVHHGVLLLHVLLLHVLLLHVGHAHHAPPVVGLVGIVVAHRTGSGAGPRRPGLSKKDGIIKYAVNYLQKSRTRRFYCINVGKYYKITYALKN